jgi:hypothetical protein
MVKQVVSGVGANSKRTDQNLVSRIQRDAKIQNASGGTYGERGELTELAQEGAAATIAPDATAVGMNPMVGGLPTTDAFLPGDDRPTSSGAPGGPGAMLLANPDSIQLALIVDAYNQELDNAI